MSLLLFFTHGLDYLSYTLDRRPGVFPVRHLRRDEDSHKRLVFLGGKGGWERRRWPLPSPPCSEPAGKTLSVSTDPAHSTSDIPGARLSGEPEQVEPKLWAVEIDTGADAA